MFEEIVGTSPALKAVLSHISKVAASDSTVLITGETGKEKSWLHERSTDGQIGSRVGLLARTAQQSPAI
jgi:transcriptional regulator of aromatic amino acid metabolism